LDFFDSTTKKFKIPLLNDSVSAGFPSPADDYTEENIDLNDCQIFDSGTSISKNGKLLTNGGRVLSVVCQDKDFDMVFEKAYKNLKKIHFEGIYFRNDIGYQVRKNFSKEN